MAHWSSCAVNDILAKTPQSCDCGDDAPSPEIQERHRRGLSTEWREYPGTGIEVFRDNCAVLYRIDGKIYAVPRQLVTMHSDGPQPPYSDKEFENMLSLIRGRR